MLEKFFYSHYNIDMVKLYDHSLQLLLLGIFPRDKNGFRVHDFFSNQDAPDWKCIWRL